MSDRGPRRQAWRTSARDRTGGDYLCDEGIREAHLTRGPAAIATGLCSRRATMGANTSSTAIAVQRRRIACTVPVPADQAGHRLRRGSRGEG
jgi:hypothetical protein